MKKIFRIIGIVAVVGLIVGSLIAASFTKPSTRDKIWDEATTMGNLDAKNHFVVYSDIVCPYCVAFENAILEHEEEFQQYLADNDILFEVRMSDFLYEYGESRSQASRDSANATYCAKSEGKFWDYYFFAIYTVWNDYFKEGGKAAYTKLGTLGEDFWIGLGQEVGLGETFVDCVKNGNKIDALEATAAKMAKVSHGMPYFKFNNYATSGFDLSWGWEYVLMYFDAGLKS